MFQPTIPADLENEQQKAQAEASAAHERANAATSAVTAARAAVEDTEHAFGADKATMSDVRKARDAREEAELLARLATEAATAAGVANAAIASRVRETAVEQAKAFVSRDAFSARLKPNDDRMASLLRELHDAAVEREQIVDERAAVARAYIGGFAGFDLEHLDWLSAALATVCASEGIHPSTHERLSPLRHGNAFVLGSQIGNEIGRPKKKAGASA